MSSKINYIALMIIAFVAIETLIPIQARADQYYPFIKVDCDKAGRMMTVTMMGPKKNEDPEKTLAKIRQGKIKDMYYLIDISKEPKRRVRCKLGKRMTVSFIGRFNGNHMANDNLEFSLNKMGLGQYFVSQYDDFSIKVTGPSEANVRACPAVGWMPTQKKDDHGCVISHIRSGVQVSD